MSTAEPLDVQFMRRALISWPFPRGKGLLMRCFQAILRGRNFPMELAPGVFVFGELNDWLLLHVFMHGWTKDPGFPFSWSLIQPGMTVVDVGGNIGLWSLPAARRVGSRGAVHAFEPFPANMERFQRNQRLSGLANVMVHPCAVSDHEGSEMFYAPAGENSGLGRLASRSSLREYEPVKVVSLDDHLSRQGVSKVDFLKVDVEGAELQVFRGASKLLSGPGAPMLMFELDRELAAAFTSTPAEIGELLKCFGYTAYRLTRGRLLALDLGKHSGHEDVFAFCSHHVDSFPDLRAAIERT